MDDAWTEAWNEYVRRIPEEPIERPIGPPKEWPTIHYTELAPAPPGSPIATEWDYYRREVGRLLAEGHEGKWVLIKGEEIIGIYNTEQEVNAVRGQRFPLQPVVMRQILTRERLLFCGYNRVCLS